MQYGEENDDYELPETFGDLDEEGFMFPHFSYAARRELYMKYCEGATIKDLSDEYGMFPSSVKAVIGMETAFYEEYLPFWDEEDLEMVMAHERMMDSQPNAVTFGVDIAKMTQQHAGRTEMAPNFIRNNRAPDRKYVEEVKKMWIEKRPNEEEIIETFKGGNVTGYFVNQLKVYKGDEAEHVGEPFERLVLHSHIRGSMPFKNQKKLKLNKGPRHAAKGIQPN